MSAAIDWSMLETQYLEDDQYRRDIRNMLCMDDNVSSLLITTYLVMISGHVLAYLFFNVNTQRAIRFTVILEF
jgi:hypothetical protein